MEDRLKSDILAEAQSFDGRLLLHTETDGIVTPIWETITDASSVKTLKEVMEEAAVQLDAPADEFLYRRIPITAERAPDFSDVKDLVEIVASLDVDESSIIVNCQLGM